MTRSPAASPSVRSPDTTGPARRVVGRYRGSRQGPLVIFVAGLHGNEPAGVEALERLFRDLDAEAPPCRGEILGVAGNLAALASGRRYLVTDLNRSWTRHRIAAIRTQQNDREQWEQFELLELLEQTLRGREAEAIILDLHTTSADSVPFFTLGDTLRNRNFARRLRLPLVLGIEEQIHGALLEFLNARGPITIGVEGGRHDDPASVDYHEHVLWVALAEAGCLESADVPRYDERLAALAGARGDLPPVFEVRGRRAVTRGDGFVMRPGFRNFEPIRAGQPLADDSLGEVLAPEDGRIFLPRYQDQGDDGFFVVRPVHPAWLRVSSLLRHLRLHFLARLMPGVRRSRRRADTLIVDRRVARWYAIEVFHLLGYRKRREALGFYAFTRRRHDLRF